MTQPAYTIEYDQRASYLTARVSGPSDSVTLKLSYLAEVSAECRARGLRKLMIVEDLGTSISPADVQVLAPQIPPLVKGIIVAFVDTRPEHHTINRLGEGLAVDRGAVGRVFRTLDDAEMWIAAVP